MAQVTVQQLADTVGASVDRLLAQMKEAGLPHSAAEEAVSEEDKQTLLTFLKRSHGEPTAAPKRITLKRKTISTLRTGGSQGKKTVNVEVRKKRTYVKRDADELAAAAEAEEENLDEQLDVTEEVEAEAAAAAEAEAEAPVVEEPVVEIEEETEEDLKNLDPEVLRQRAAERRKAKEAQEVEDRKAAAEARKLEEERKQAAATASAVVVEKEGDVLKRPKRLHEAPSANREAERRKPARGKLDRNAPAGRGKKRGHNLSLSDLDAAESGLSRRRGSRKKIKATHEEHSKHGFEMPTENIVYDVEVADMISVGGMAQADVGQVRSSYQGADEARCNGHD